MPIPASIEKVVADLLEMMEWPYTPTEAYPGQDFVIGLCEEGMIAYTQLYLDRPDLKEICKDGVTIMKELHRLRHDHLKPRSFEVEVMEALC